MVSLTYLGHSAFMISGGGVTLLVDPYLVGSPIQAPDIERADFILVSHDHHDHLGDAVEIAERTGGTVVSTPEVLEELKVENKLSMNMGAQVEAAPRFKVAMVPAFHTSRRGSPVGFVMEVEDVSIYHGGDTALFGDMALIRRLYHPKVALLPMGGRYVMGPREAAEALTLIEPAVAIPMHYKTFPVLEKDAEGFRVEARRKAPSVKVVVLDPGQTFNYP